MLFTDLPTILLLGSAIIAVFMSGWAVVNALRAQKYANDCVIWVQKENKDAVSLRRMAEVEATLTDLADSYHALLKAHKKLRSRIAMRNRNHDKSEVDLEPVIDVDAASTPNKNELRVAAKQLGLLK